MVKDTLRDIRSSKEIIVSADKSPILCKVPVNMYKKILREEATKKYKVSSKNSVNLVNQESLQFVERYEPGLETRVEIFSQPEGFFTFKDHKQGFPSKFEVRLINPAKPQTGKITQKKLQEINSNLRTLTKLNQLQSTKDAITWFESIKGKKRRYFLGFDIKSFYPNITERILKNALSWARSLIKITKADENLIFMARRSFLFIEGRSWVKKENSTFDVTMGAFDGAEVAEFIGIFILDKLSSIMKISDFALYRDDGIIALEGTKRTVDETRKKIEQIFKEIGFQVDIPPTGLVKSIDFLDVTFNLNTGIYAPYRKPMNKPIFIHKDSNHPKVIKTEVPCNTEKRLSNNSSNQKTFDNAKPPYIDALKNSRFSNVDLKFQPSDKKNTKVNTRKVIYCNLPWNMEVKTNIGKEFLSLVDMFKNFPQAKYINRHIVKLSYSTMRNLKSHIAASNFKKLRPKQSSSPEQDCNCMKQNIVCPVNGKCKTDNVVYETTVKTKHSVKSYIGMTSRPFIDMERAQGKYETQKSKGH